MKSFVLYNKELFLLWRKSTFIKILSMLGNFLKHSSLKRCLLKILKHENEKKKEIHNSLYRDILFFVRTSEYKKV